MVWAHLLLQNSRRGRLNGGGCAVGAYGGVAQASSRRTDLRSTRGALTACVRHLSVRHCAGTLPNASNDAAGKPIMPCSPGLASLALKFDRPCARCMPRNEPTQGMGPCTLDRDPPISNPHTDDDDTTRTALKQHKRKREVVSAVPAR